MNSEVVKNFRLEIRKEEPQKIGQTIFQTYIFECRNCQTEIKRTEPITGERRIDPIKLEFDLSLHLMQCFNYPPEENE